MKLIDFGPSHCSTFARAGSALKRFALVAAVLGSLAVAVPCYAGGYCAIAFSVHTCRYGYSDSCNSRHEAERIALNELGTEDGQIVGWAHNSYVALARGSGTTWGCGVGPTRGDAERKALAACPSTNAYIVKWVYSFD